MRDGARSSQGSVLDHDRTSPKVRKNLTRPKGNARSNSSPKGCVSPLYQYITLAKHTRHSSTYFTPHLHSLPYTTLPTHSCLPFPLQLMAMAPLHCRIRPRATSNHPARAPTLLASHRIQGVMSPCIVSKTFQVTQRPSSRAKKSSAQKFRRTLPQKCVDNVTHGKTQGGLNCHFSFLSRGCIVGIHPSRTRHTFGAMVLHAPRYR